MTDEEKEAIENLRKILFTTMQANECGLSNNDFKTEIKTYTDILGLIEKQQTEIEKLQMTLAGSIADRVNSAFEQKYKNDEDLEMLYKGCQIELEKKEAIIDEMVEKLSYVEDLKLDVCVNCKEDCRIPRNQGDCIKTDCIKEYFKNKVQKT